MAIPESVLARILHSATRAPSGDNSQPWRFIVEDDCIQIGNIPDADTSPFNYHQASNYLALGAALENARITAEAEGYAVDIAYFPEPDETIVAQLRLSAGTRTESPLFDAIERRASNRHRYMDTPLPEDVLEKLRSCVRTGEGVELSLVTNTIEVREIGELMSAGERITLENKFIHGFLFKHVTWNLEDDARRHGFYIKTFEFKPPQEAAFRLFSNWRILRLFHPFGITRAIARDMAGVYGSSAAFGAISLDASTTPEGLVRAGMLLERIWLTTTSLGVGLQATASIPLLSFALVNGGGQELSEAHQQLAKERAAALKEKFSIPQEQQMVFAFRLGYAPEPSARTSRAEPVIERRA